MTFKFGYCMIFLNLNEIDEISKFKTIRLLFIIKFTKAHPFLEDQ
jgi:hypothetical protein